MRTLFALWLALCENIAFIVMGIKFDEGDEAPDMAHCEHCEDKGLVLLGDGRLLCWEHYIEACKAQHTVLPHD